MSSTAVVRALSALAARVATAAVAQPLYWLAFLWRRALRRTTFVAITGSHGKTTAKELLGAILETRAPTLRTGGNDNTGLLLTRTMLRVRPRHRYAVVEIGVGAPGEMRRLARLVRPDVVVMLTVLRTHMRAFGSVEAHAAEKAILLEALPPGGVAVLDADDPRVAAMTGRVAGAVVRFGTSPGLDVWAEGATSAWPDRLEFDARTRAGEKCRVRTRLVGAHWCAAATAALAAARALGIPLGEAAAAIAGVEPFTGRMQPMLLPSGAVVVRDDYDGSIDTFERGFEFFAAARAGRRIAVFSDASEFGSTKERKRLEILGGRVGAVADLAVFVGHLADHGRAGAVRGGMPPESARAFPDLRSAAEHLGTLLRPGDLVYLKGRQTDHLARLFFALLGPIQCEAVACGKMIDCDRCPKLGSSPADRARALPAPPPKQDTEPP